MIDISDIVARGLPFLDKPHLFFRGGRWECLYHDKVDGRTIMFVGRKNWENR
jgi:hypothetical protein